MGGGETRADRAVNNASRTPSTRKTLYWVFFARRYVSHPEHWGIAQGSDTEWLYHQPLLEFDELDHVSGSPSVLRARRPLVLLLLRSGDPAPADDTDQCLCVRCWWWWWWCWCWWFCAAILADTGCAFGGLSSNRMALITSDCDAMCSTSSTTATSRWSSSSSAARPGERARRWPIAYPAAQSMQQMWHPNTHTTTVIASGCGLNHSFSEFDFRTTPHNTGQDRSWHRDIGPHGLAMPAAHPPPGAYHSTEWP